MEVSSLPPEDLMGADKLFPEARFGSINGPLKLGALCTLLNLSDVGWLSISHLMIKKTQVLLLKPLPM